MITIKPDLIKIKQGDGYVPLLAIKGEQGEQGEPGAVDYGSVYPIGSIYMSVNDTSPSSLFGGTWEQLKDSFLLGAGDTYAAGATGGSADAKLINHNHALISYGNGSVIGEVDQLIPDASGTWGRTIATGGGYFAENMEATGRFITSAPNFDYNEMINDGGAGANMPPYLAVYMWKRTA